KRQKGRTAATAERIEHRPYRCRDSIHARPPRSVHKSLDYVYDRAGIIEEPVPEWRPAAPSSARTGCWAAKISNSRGSTMRSFVRNPIALVVGAVLAPVAIAHHGFGTFVMDEDIKVTGTVTRLEFVNPHSWLYLDVEKDGETIAMRCEMRSANTLRRSGWTPDLFPVGKRITIEGSPD